MSPQIHRWWLPEAEVKEQNEMGEGDQEKKSNENSGVEKYSK